MHLETHCVQVLPGFVFACAMLQTDLIRYTECLCLIQLQVICWARVCVCVCDSAGYERPYSDDAESLELLHAVASSCVALETIGGHVFLELNLKQHWIECARLSNIYTILIESRVIDNLQLDINIELTMSIFCDTAAFVLVVTNDVVFVVEFRRKNTFVF